MLQESQSLTSERVEKLITPLKRPEWVPDTSSETCMGCGSEFTFINRRHHCRGCGKLFCNDCCDHWLLLPEEFEYPEPQRTCLPCYKNLSNIDYSRHFDAFGDPNNHAIVLIHGATATRKCHGPQIEALSKQFYVLAPDLPGHGSRYSERLTMQSAVHSIADLIEHHTKDKKAIVYGYSLGGYVAMAVAGTVPHLCSGVIVGGAGTDMADAAGGIKMMGVYYSIISNETKASLVKNSYAGWPLYAQVSEKNLKECMMRCGSFYDAWPDIQQTMCGEDYPAHLKKYDGPILFLNGENDFRTAEPLWMQSAKNGRLYIVRGAGHMLTLDDRFIHECNEAILTFCRFIHKMKDPEAIDSEPHKDFTEEVSF
eukprot:TRINITY_DN2395_c0_g1_i1.p1 TRINITY_DN2395_c0_g1~~TRINITY_DN2395_c0_g1_i1.p1  ORF type:complete len:368 (-),score=64.09 TRINITY_DN2395_c0_g1_i1:138-1241(-)